MPEIDLVRPSRDGDQFHYIWAARQCLRLLPGQSDLIAVTIEGPSAVESTGGASLPGDQLIDVGLYYGSEAISAARKVQYVQLKHSTRHANDAWTASGLAKTIAGFAERYARLRGSLSAAEIGEKFSFTFTTNRPISINVREACEDISTGGNQRHPSVADYLTHASQLATDEVKPFFQLLSLDGGEQGLWDQRNLLSYDLRGYLPDADYDAPVLLKELVTRKATTEFEHDPSIRRHDVLRALRVTEDVLLPAPCIIPRLADALPREQECDIRRGVLEALAPVVIHADGGVGKSVTASRLATDLPVGSEAVLYDCYGDGLYRQSLNFRHRHRDAIVQIANELAARGLCHPLIPSAHADAKLYMSALLHRLRQASQTLKAAHPNAVLVLIIDAADNAELAAAEQKEPGSFVPDLARVPLPDGVKLVLTSRSHRRDLLKLPVDAIEIELRPFSLRETETHLRKYHPNATVPEAEEFAVLSSHNPRVQALALSQNLPLIETLRQLGPNPTTVEQTISDLLGGAIARLRDKVGPIEGARIDEICRGLAVLRPLVPIPVLSALASVPESAIRSFAYDLGRPLLVKGDSLHFLDEPAETWFRETFRPEGPALKAFLERLRPLAAQSSYVAAMLPQLLLEAGHLEELVALALSQDALPIDNPLERRDVELQRLMFALKACLQDGHHLAAAKLALKAGGETAGEQRQNGLIQSNTDLAAALMAPDRIEEIVSRRTFGSGWMGSHHAYDAGFLSGREELSAEASSRLRMAMDWLTTWARSQKSSREAEDVSDEDRVELTMASLRLRGAREAAHFLRRWRHRRLAFDAGMSVGRRLIDLGRGPQVDLLIEAAGNDVWLLLGLCHAAREGGQTVPAAPLARLIRILSRPGVSFEESKEWNANWNVLYALTSVIEIAAKVLPPDFEAWGELLARYLPKAPPHDFTSRYGFDQTPLLRAYALEAELRGRRLDLADIAPPEVKAELEDSARTHSRSQGTETFLHEVGGRLPWAILGAQVLCGREVNIEEAVRAALKASAFSESRAYREHGTVRNSLALSWLRILLDFDPLPGAQVEAFRTWLADLERPLWPDTLIVLCRRAARAPGLGELALELSAAVLKTFENSREDAESRCESFVRLARAIFTVSNAEARAIFDQAVEISSRIGEENIDRWTSLLDLGSAAAEPGVPRPATAYRLSRIAELTYEYVARDKHFDWDRTVEALAGLCPTSAFAILSRWRDRGFGDPGRLLPELIENLISRGELPPSTLVVLSGIDARWNRINGLKQFVAAEPSQPKRSAGAELAYRYIRLETSSRREWLDLQDFAAGHDLILPDLDRLAAFTPDEPAKDSSDPTSRAANPREHRAPNWDEVFDGVDFTDTNALREAYRSVREFDPPYEFEEFFRHAGRRTPAGKEADFVSAIGAWADFGFFELRYFVDAYPRAWLSRLSFRRALREVILKVCAQNPTRVFLRSWYNPIPFDKLEIDGVVTREAVIDATLTGLANEVDVLSAGALFHMTEALVHKLMPSQAEEALEFGLELLDGMLRPDDGDGAWRDDLAPEGDVTVALAGYIWAGLGSPVVSVRWEHAHVVRAIVELGVSELLSALVVHAQRGGGGAFSADGLVFYTLHARQWLLIGLARGAVERPSHASSITEFLEQCLQEPHVLIRALAAQALGAVVSAGLAAPEIAAALEKVNRPVHEPVLHTDWSDRYDVESEDVSVEDLKDDEKYYFGIDIGPYWFRPLGMAFGLGETSIEHRARAVLRTQMPWARGGWRTDARHVRKIFGEGETHHSHGSMPKVDDLTAYSSYHAMMIVAAELLEVRAPVQHVDENEDAFCDWLADHLLSRSDGRWLADARGPMVLARPPRPSGYSDLVWPWEVSAPYLDGQLMAPDGRTVLWGYWSSGDDDASETVSVRTALVTRTAALSLISALQTAPDTSRFSLPSLDGHGDDQAFSAGKLKGWIGDDGQSRRLDDADPWSEGLHYPGPAIGSSYASDQELAARDPDARCWDSNGSGTLLRELWTRVQGVGREATQVAGWRLTADRDFLRNIEIQWPDEQLVFSVEVRRSPPKHAQNRRDLVEYPWPYCRYYLLGSDGETIPL